MFHIYRYYGILLLIAPTLFFMPKFFELQTTSKVHSTQTEYNCTLEKEEVPDYSFATFQTTTIKAVHTESFQKNFSLSKRSEKIEENQDFCTGILELIQNTSSRNLFDGQTDKHKNESSSEKYKTISLLNDKLKILYRIDNLVAYILVIESLNITMLDHTSLRRNPLYYKIYCLGLTTVITQILPMGILLFFNIRIRTALKTSRETTKLVRKNCHRKR